jgi:Icc protein
MKNTHSFSRRHFVKNFSFASAFFIGGGIRSFTEEEVNSVRDQVVMRFAVASDAHYGQANTPYEAMMDTIIDKINFFHGTNPLDFCVMNGDIVHDEKSFLSLAKGKIDGLQVPYYVTRGNHDKCSPDFWQDVWKMPLNHTILVKDSTILLGDTSNEQGTYVSPDLGWLASQLEANKKRKNVFLFLHIPQAKWTKNGIETPAFFELVKKFPNIRAVFHGHEHDQDGVQMVGKLPFLFDSHIGGSWGTVHKGFRVVELLKNGTMLTYLMDPVNKMNELRYSF